MTMMTPTPIERIDPPEPGLYPGVPQEVYRSWRAFAWSDLKHVGWSLEKFIYAWTFGLPDDDTLAWQDGRLFHTCLLEPDDVYKRYAARPSVYPILEKVQRADVTVKRVDGEGLQYQVARGRGGRRETWDAMLVPVPESDEWVIGGSVPEGLVRVAMLPWRSNATFCDGWSGGIDKEIIKRDRLDVAQAMAGRLRELPQVQQFLDGAEIEVSMVWRDPQTQLLCKSRMDIYKKGQIADPKKSAHCVDWERFARDVRYYGYAGQAGMYRDGVNWLYKNVLNLALPEVPMFRWLAVEDAPPYSPAVYDLYDRTDAVSYDWLQYGRQTWHGYLQRVAHALKTEHWPGHNADNDGKQTEPVELVPPDWLKLQVA